MTNEQVVETSVTVNSNTIEHYYLTYYLLRPTWLVLINIHLFVY